MVGRHLVPDLAPYCTVANDDYNTQTHFHFLLRQFPSLGHMYYLQISHSRHSKIAWDVCDWFLSRHLPDCELDLSILGKSLKSEGVVGWMLAFDENEYEIEIENNLRKNEFITTLLHELYHVFQYTKGYQCENEAYHMEKILTEQYLTS
jgi:hypothetical protein